MIRWHDTVALDLDAIRTRHVPRPPGLIWCAACGQRWGDTGCDTATVLAALDEALTVEAGARAMWLEGLKMAKEDLAAAEAREARLREALEGLDVPFRWLEANYPKALVEMPTGIFRAFGEARAALSPEAEPAPETTFDPATGKYPPRDSVKTPTNASPEAEP